MISRFCSDLDMRDLNHESKGKFRLMLLTPLEYESASLNKRIIVPKDFVTDLASIPRSLWSFLPPLGRYDRAAVVHDWLYQTGCVTRETADFVMLEAMRASHVDAVTRYTLYAGVCAGGGPTWRRYRHENALEQLLLPNI